MSSDRLELLGYGRSDVVSKTIFVLLNFSGIRYE